MALPPKTEARVARYTRIGSTALQKITVQWVCRDSNVCLCNIHVFQVFAQCTLQIRLNCAHCDHFITNWHKSHSYDNFKCNGTNSSIACHPTFVFGWSGHAWPGLLVHQSGDGVCRDVTCKLPIHDRLRNQRDWGMRHTKIKFWSTFHVIPKTIYIIHTPYFCFTNFALSPSLLPAINRSYVAVIIATHETNANRVFMFWLLCWSLLVSNRRLWIPSSMLHWRYIVIYKRLT